MRVFVISLKRATDRRADMTAQLQKLGLTFEFFDAYDGRDLSDIDPLYDAAVARERNGEPLSKGQRGCAMSHRALYERIVHEDIDHALILEDDVVLSPRIVSLLSDETFLSSASWDWLQIDYNTVGWPYIKDSFRSANVQIHIKPAFLWYFIAKLPYILGLALFEKLRDEYHHATRPALVTFYRPLYLASAYVITKKGAQTLFDLQTPVAYAADHLPNAARRKGLLKMRVLSPLMSYQNKHYQSSIDPRYNE